MALTAKHKAVAKLVTDTYWEWHKAEFHDLAPGIEYIALNKIVHAVLDTGAKGDEVLEAMKYGAPGLPTVKALLKRVADARWGRLPKKVYPHHVMTEFDRACRERRHLENGWQRNTIDGVYSVVETLGRWGKSEGQIYARLLMWLKHRPCDPMTATDVSRMISNEEEDVLARQMAWDEMERRIFAWGSVKP